MKNRYPKMNEKYSGDPFVDIRQMTTKFKPNDLVFVCSCNDLFTNNVPSFMIEEILKYCQKFKETTFYFQSKNPIRMINFIEYINKKSILCTTIESCRNNQFMGNTPDVFKRMKAMQVLNNYGFKTEITIEPIMIYDCDLLIDMLRIAMPIKINIGANSNKRIKLPEPTKESILKLISECEKFTEVYLKTSLQRLIR